MKQVLVLGVALTVGAGLASRAQAQKEQVPNLAEVMQQVMGAMGGASTGSADGEAYQPISFRILKEQLPEELTGMRRTSASGEKTATLGMTVSVAEATYEGEDDESLDLSISDIGGLGGFAAMAQYAWTMSEYERESDAGFERTMTWKGHRGSEEFQEKGKRGKISIMLDNKVVISIQGSGVPFERLQEARDALDVDALLGLEREKAEPEAE